MATPDGKRRKKIDFTTVPSVGQFCNSIRFNPVDGDISFRRAECLRTVFLSISLLIGGINSHVLVAMAPPNVKIDNLFGNLKELQKGRLSLEQNLEELRAKKRGLESALEEASARQAQAKYVNLKMRETLKIAQHKVNQTQQQHASIRVEADAKGKRVSQLNKRIEGERGKQTEEMLQFGEQIAELSERFTSAKNYHSDESLQQQISQTGQESFGFETKEAVCTEEVEELQKQQSENVQEQGDDLLYLKCIFRENLVKH